MKQLLLLAVLLVSFGNVNAQKIRFTDTSNKWTLLHTNKDGGAISTWLTSMQYISDTIIDGVQYRHLNNGPDHALQYQDLAIREDTIIGRLYFRFLSPRFWLASLTDTSEHLFFDYHLNVGDTFKVSYASYNWAEIVQLIDSVRLGATYHKHWHFVNGYEFIEGIGTMYGPTYLICPSTFEDVYQIRCFKNNRVQPACSPSIRLPLGSYWKPMWANMVLLIDSFDNAKSCEYKTLEVAIANSENRVSISPNPGNSAITLHLPASIPAASVQITDCTGRIIKRLNTSSSETNIGQYLSTSGVYFYQVLDAATGQRFMGKFIFIP